MTDKMPATPLFDRKHGDMGYELNKMAMSLSHPENREAFQANEEAYLDRYALTPEQRKAVRERDWEAMVRLGGNVFYILKISAISPIPMTAIGAAQLGMDHEEFLTQVLGKAKRDG
jgi:protocatechuate 4,5-dioxygenase alpha chain